MSTVDEMKEETETREMDDFERFVRDQGQIRDSAINQEYIERNFEDKKGMTNIFE
jgi:hypothetical protein